MVHFGKQQEILRGLSPSSLDGSIVDDLPSLFIQGRPSSMTRQTQQRSNLVQGTH